MVNGLLVGTGWYGLRRRRVLDAVVVFAVRRDWPDWRTHEIVSPRLTEQAAVALSITRSIRRLPRPRLPERNA